jgi:hypothetical protein
MKRILASVAIAMMALAMTPTIASASVQPTSASLAASSCPIFDLNAVYHVGGPAHPFIRVVGGTITVNMDEFHRPPGTGYLVQCDVIRIFFPDDRWYTGVLELPGIIRWQENGTVWRKAVEVPDVRGLYENGATVTLVNVGLVKGVVSRPTTCDPDLISRVVTQSPAALTFADLGSRVNLTIPRMAPNCP